jgi:hypothetical protein
MLVEAVPPVGVSVATTVHEPVEAPLKVTPVKVTVSEVVFVDGWLGLAGDNVQFVDDNVTVSALPPVVTSTFSVMGVFAVAVVGGDVKDRVAAADAGRTPTRATPAITNAAADPRPKVVPSLERSVREIPLRPNCIFIPSPSSGRNHSNE